jgi:hypothetical protein
VSDVSQVFLTLLGLVAAGSFMAATALAARVAFLHFGS